MSDNFNATRIARNSLYLYIRMLITMWFNLWATRLVLSGLGIDDMGVYGVVGGIVGMFAVLTGAVTSAVQRFLSFELGRGGERMSRVFSSAVNAVLLVAVVLLLLLEVGGLWYLNNVANLPSGRLQAAGWVFQFSVVACMTNLLAIPYNALVIAHERMGAFSVISLVQVLMSWGIAYSLMLVAQDSRLVVYAALLMLVGILVWLMYVWYCRRKFAESHYRFVSDKALLREIGRFTGITTVSNVLQTVTTQGLVLIINGLFGVALNAVYMIAMQLKNAVLSFGMNIFKAISPQITKTYAAGDEAHFRLLVHSGSKIEVYMVLFVLLPFLCKTEYILHLWLGEVPEYTVAFCRCSIFLSVIHAAFEPIRTAVLASNNISRFLLIPDTFYLVVALGTAYAVGKVSGNPEYMIMTVVAVEIASCALRVWYAGKACCLKVSAYVLNVVMPCAVVGAAGFAVAYALSRCFRDGMLPLVGYVCVNSTVLLVIILAVGITPKERSFARRAAGRLTDKLRSKR